MGKTKIPNVTRQKKHFLPKVAFAKEKFWEGIFLYFFKKFPNVLYASNLSSMYECVCFWCCIPIFNHKFLLCGT